MGKALVATAIVLASAIAVTAAQAQDSYEATLSGTKMTPPTDSRATGLVRITVVGPNAFFQVILADITGVEAVHVHVAGGTVSAGDVALYDGPPSGTINGLLTIGAFNATSIHDMRWDQFLTALWIGRAWVQVHTKDHPDGDITGRLVRLPSAPSGPGPLMAVESGSDVPPATR